MARPARTAAKLDALLGHWLWAVPALLLVALIATPELNKYSPSPDEFLTIINVGWVVDGPFSPVEVLESLARRSPQQAPLYYWLLNLWGNFVAHEIALARVLTLYCGLLFLALCFRIVGDFVAPVAGLMALAIIASNAYLNLFWPYARAYILFLLTTALALWLYLRLMFRLSGPRRGDYVSFFLACLALAATHAFSIIVFAALGIFHLLSAPKGRRWLRVCLCVALALLLYSPWAYVMATLGAPTVWSEDVLRTANTIAVLSTWAELMFNGSPLLLLLPLAGLALARRRRQITLEKTLLPILYYLAVVIAVEEAVGAISIERMRYLQPGFLLLLLPQAAGLYALYRFRRWLGLLALLWIVAGVSYHAYQSAKTWRPEADDRAASMLQAPVHEIGRYARRVGSEANIYAYRTLSHLLRKGRPGAGTPLGLYLDLTRMNYAAADSLAGFESHITSNALIAPSVWVYFHTSRIDAAEADAFDSIMHRYHYTRCHVSRFALDTLLIEYWWRSLSCQEPQPIVSGATSLIDYEFFGARESEDGRALVFSDAWTAKAGASPERYNMSYQLISEDRENVAQLDLPLVNAGLPRQFSVDVSRAPAGRYRLVALLYDRESGDRLKWSAGDEFVPEMLTLAEIEL